MASKDPARPNIMFVLTDDQGAWAMGCAGNPEIYTPNLDRLAASGVRLTRSYCTSPVCSPARASLLTGRVPSAHGVHDWLRDGNVGEHATEFLAGQSTYTDVLAANGYDCGLSGKWHLGASERPQHGFTHWYAHQRGGGPYYDAPMIRDGEPVNEPDYLTHAITRDAIAFVERAARHDRPFYAAVHYTAPHSPWIDQHPAEYVNLYADCAFDSCPTEPLHPWARPETVPSDTLNRRRDSLKGYFGAVTALDEGVGQLLDKLAELGLTEATLVWFTSDNGFNCGHHGFWGKGNGTFPLNMYDTSVLVPTLIAQPGRIPGGREESRMVSGYDVRPTILEYAGLTDPAADELAPGLSFAATLLGTPVDNGAEDVVTFDEYGPVRMIASTEFKYVHRYPYGPHELYDLVNDPGERKNLIDDAGYRAVVTELRARLEEWFVRYTDPRRDGVRQPVTGKGQGAPVDAGATTPDRPTFYPLDDGSDR